MKIEVDLKGLNKLTKKLNEIGKELLLIDLLSDEFMSKYSNFKSFEEFIDNSHFDFTDLNSIDEKELDVFVNKNSQFSNWNDMLSQAYALWIKSQLK